MSKAVDSLPAATELDHYVIERTLSRGGFSIVYLATVKDAGKYVAIKEYMPTKLARRSPAQTVVPASEAERERFNHGRKLFFKEASALGQIKHPNIVNVVNFFASNGTVYMVMEYEPGHNLQAYIRKHRGYLSETFLRTVFPSLLSGLRCLHAARLLHLDIKPANIHIRPGGNPLLLDFGAVHQIFHSRRYEHTQVVTPGYAPIEQYSSDGYVGPWTDIYAIGATMRSCIEGMPPPPARERHENDNMRPAGDAFRKRYSSDLLYAIDWAMELSPLHRPQSVDELLRLFAGPFSMTAEL